LSEGKCSGFYSKRESEKREGRGLSYMSGNKALKEEQNITTDISLKEYFKA
jgi:hypothetical protein